MPNYSFFVRITYPYSHIQALVSMWGLKCEKLAVYEHEGEKTQKVHCHLVVMNSCVDKKQLRNIGSKYCDLKGNENASFAKLDSERKPLVYMTKGVLDPKYLKTFTKEEAQTWKEQWVAPSSAPPKIPWAVTLYGLAFPYDKDRDTDEFDYGSFPPETDRRLIKFERVLKHVNNTCLRFNEYMFTPKCCQEVQTLMKTYCYRWDISIPQDYKKRFLV